MSPLREICTAGSEGKVGLRSPASTRHGLAGLVTTSLQQDLRGGALFVFANRPRTRLKVLYFDGTGLWLMTKRLEEGTFSWPQGEQKVIALRPEAFAMLTDGIDLRRAKMRPWYDRGEKENTSWKVPV